MKKKNKKKQSTKLIFIIQVFMVFLLSSGFLSLYALQYEKKISNIYEKIDQIDKEKKILQVLKGTLSVNYGQGTMGILTAEDSYLLEKNEIKEINYCIRNWEISRYSTNYDYFFTQYKKISNQKFYDPILFEKIKKKRIIFSKWHKKNKDKEPCLQKDNRIFINKITKEFVDSYYYFIINLDKVFRDINKTEDTLFEEVKIESSKASNIYIFTFFILLFSTIVIILADVRSNRGSDD